MTPTPTSLETDEVADVDPEDWTLSVRGTVTQPLELNQADLRSLDT